MSNKTPNLGLYLRGPLSWESLVQGAANQWDLDLNMAIIDTAFAGGLSGTTWYTGTSNPSSIPGSVNGSFYLNTSNGSVWRLESGTWVNRGALPTAPILGIPNLGQIPIGQGDGTSVFADPLVQGIQAEGTTAATVNPVLVGGKDGSGNLKDLILDSSGRPTVNVNGTVPVSAASLPLPTNAAQETSGNLATLAGAVASTKMKVSAAVGDVIVEVSDGTNILGTTVHPVKVDPTGTTTQPISGTVAQGTAATGTAGWPITQGNVAAITAAWTSATGANAALSSALIGYQTVVLSLNVSGSITGGVLTFEVSDDNGTTWYPILAYRSGIAVGDSTVTLSVAGSILWQVNVTGFTNFRTRLSSVIIGTGTASLRQQASSGNQTSPSTNIAAIGGNAVLPQLVGALPVTIKGGNAGFSLEDTNGVLNENLKNIANSAVVTAAAGVQKVGVVGATGTALDGTTAGVVDENVKNVGGSAVVTAAAGVQKVGVVGNTGTSLETTAGTLDENIKNVGNSAVATAAAGVQKVGIVGSAGATVDGVITAAAAPANAVAQLVVNNTTPPSLATGQSVAAQCDYEGSLFVKPIRRAQTTSKATTITNSAAATTVLGAQAAGIFADISNLIITVVPAATADIAFTATLSDGTNSYIFDMDTGALATATADPTQINVNFNPPLPATAAATAWTITLSVSTVTVHITVVAVLQKAS